MIYLAQVEQSTDASYASPTHVGRVYFVSVSLLKT
jgi:hypothetical protein